MASRKNKRNPLIIALVLGLLAPFAIAQEAEPIDEETAATVDGDADTDGAAVAESEADDDADNEANDEPLIDLDDPALADLDRQTYDEDDDDFVPTEEVPADQAIPFPTDI